MDEFAYELKYCVSATAPVVYLAGGMRGDWQDRVKKYCPELRYVDPRAHGPLASPHAYTTWDLLGVRRSDIVLVYIEASNPLGLGLMFEAGYAAALGKVLLVVDEKSQVDATYARYSGMLHASASAGFATLDEALTYLQTFQRL